MSGAGGCRAAPQTTFRRGGPALPPVEVQSCARLRVSGIAIVDGALAGPSRVVPVGRQPLPTIAIVDGALAGPSRVVPVGRQPLPYGRGPVALHGHPPPLRGGSIADAFST